MATWSTPPDFVPLQTLTDTVMDALSTDLSALWIYTAAGSMGYATANDTLAELAIGNPGQKLHVNDAGNAPEWQDNIRYWTGQLNREYALTSGDLGALFIVPPELDGWNLVYVVAYRSSGTGTLNLQVRNVTDGVDMLSTAVTVDSGETTSLTAATPAVIDTSHDDVATGDLISIDRDNNGTSTLNSGIILGFQHA